MSEAIQETTENKQTSRRDFLKTAVTALGAAAALSVPVLLEKEKTEKIKNSECLVFDIFGEPNLNKPSLQNLFSTEFKIQQKLQQWGLSMDKLTSADVSEINPTSDDERKLVGLLAFYSQFANHGAQVTEVLDKFSKRFAGSNERNTQSFIDLIEIEAIDFDKVGNPLVRYKLSGQSLEDYIEHTKASVINMSFQLGSNSFKYVMFKEEKKYEQQRISESEITINGKKETKYSNEKGEEISKEEYQHLDKVNRETVISTLPNNKRYGEYDDGYAMDGKINNLLEMVDLAKKFPEKVIVAAGGNWVKTQPNYVEYKKRLERAGMWPRNLILTGVYHSSIQFSVPLCIGADLYVEGDFLRLSMGFREASSFSTPIVTKLIQLMISRGYDTIEKIRNGLAVLSNQKTFYTNTGYKGTLSLLDTENIERAFGNRDSHK